MDTQMAKNKMGLRRRVVNLLVHLLLAVLALIWIGAALTFGRWAAEAAS